MFEGAPKQSNLENVTEIKSIISELHEKLGLNNLDDFQDDRLVAYAKHVSSDDNYWKEANMEDSQAKLKELLA